MYKRQGFIIFVIPLTVMTRDFTFRTDTKSLCSERRDDSNERSVLSILSLVGARSTAISFVFVFVRGSRSNYVQRNSRRCFDYVNSKYCCLLYTSRCV